jgi:hypothetical protein
VGNMVECFVGDWGLEVGATKDFCRHIFNSLLPSLVNKLSGSSSRAFRALWELFGSSLEALSELSGRSGELVAVVSISHHLKMLSSISPVNDSPLVLKNMPVLFTSSKKYLASNTFFDNAIYELAEDDADELFHSKNYCTNHDCRIGEYCFCEATKVDLAESVKKIILGKRRINVQAHF